MILAWHNDPTLKATAVARMREHAAADRLIRGAYIDLYGGQWRGCLHGCLTAEALAAEQQVPVAEVDAEDRWHAESERLWGIPHVVGRLLDGLYEQSTSDAGELAVAILEAIPVGVDLAPVTDRLMLDLLADPDRGVWRHTEEGSRQRQAVEQVATLYRRRLAGDDPPREQWHAAAANAAYADAAAYAATAAANAAYADAAAYAATAAANAAYADADGAYAAAAAGEWWTWWQNRVLHHLTTAQTPQEATP